MADEPTTDAPDEQPEPEQPVRDPAEEMPAGAVQQPSEETPEQPETAEPAEEAPAEPVAEQPVEEGEPVEPVAEQPTAEGEQAAEPAAEPPTVEGEQAAEPIAEQPAEQPANEAGETPEVDAAEDEEEEEEPAPRVKPSVPGAHLEVDIVPEGVDPLAPEQPVDPYAVEAYEEPQAEEEVEEVAPVAETISTAAIDLAAGARYKATGKRKTAIARVILRPGSGTYLVNGRALDEHFPRITLQRNIRQPLETVGYQERMDVVARLHGGGISAQAGALRHGISRALLEADPNLRGELKRRGFLTRDSRAKERKKAGLKKARKRPQFSKR
jgi:small subunit ribosomal protein S9